MIVGGGGESVVKTGLLVIQSFSQYNLMPCHYPPVAGGGGGEALPMTSTG